MVLSGAELAAVGPSRPADDDQGDVDGASDPATGRVEVEVEVEAPMMGTLAHLVLRGDPPPLTGPSVTALRNIEGSWSRFIPESELSRLNRTGGRPVVVTAPTAMLVERSVWAWRQTGGLFDPTVLHAVMSAGYDRTFTDLAPVTAAGPTAPAPGCDGIEIDSESGLVTLPAGITIDAGGIGKGLAADMVAVRAVEDGVAGALVSIGGDLRVAGRPPAEGWEIELDHHVAPPARVNLVDGAVATSSTLRRRWATLDGYAHHVIDPRTGRPSAGDVVACSVVAAEAWWAEALATALLVGWGDPRGEPLLRSLLDDVGALLTRIDGRQVTIGAFADSFSLGASCSPARSATPTVRP